MAQPGACEARCSRIAQHAVDGALVLRRRSARKGQRDRPEVQIEQAIAQTRLVVVVALGLGSGDDLDLPGI
jgi:hypothetical protein